MSVRRLASEDIQLKNFAFSAENKAWAEREIGKYPAGRQASAVIPLLWQAQKQAGGWLPRAAIEHVAEVLDMPRIRVLEVATFYTMFNLEPVGTHYVQLCGTTPCALRGAELLKKVCHERIGPQRQVTPDGKFSWLEVECLGACCNAPMVQINDEFYEDLSPESFARLLDDLAAGRPVKLGPQNGRRGSEPEGAVTTLADTSLYDGSRLGEWRKRFDGAAGAAVSAAEQPVAKAAPAPTAAAAPVVAAAARPASASPAGASDDTPSAGGPATAAKGSTGQAAGAAATPVIPGRREGPSPEPMLTTPDVLAPPTPASPASPVFAGSGLSPSASPGMTATAPAAPVPDTHKPQLLAAARGGQPDDLKLIWGVGPKLEQMLHRMGVFHFDQIAAWTADNLKWVDQNLTGFRGRAERDKWIEQARKLATGWRPDRDIGDKPKL